MFRASTSAAGVRFLSSVKEGRGLKRSAREAGVDKEVGYRWLREGYLRHRRSGVAAGEAEALLGFSSVRVAVWEAEVADSERHHLRVDVGVETAFWTAYESGVELNAAARSAGVGRSTAYRWLERRFDELRAAGMTGRSVQRLLRLSDRATAHAEQRRRDRVLAERRAAQAARRDALRSSRGFADQAAGLGQSITTPDRSGTGAEPGTGGRHIQAVPRPWPARAPPPPDRRAIAGAVSSARTRRRPGRRKRRTVRTPDLPQLPGAYQGPHSGAVAKVDAFVGEDAAPDHQFQQAVGSATRSHTRAHPPGTSRRAEPGHPAGVDLHAAGGQQVAFDAGKQRLQRSQPAVQQDVRLLSLRDTGARIRVSLRRSRSNTVTRAPACAAAAAANRPAEAGADNEDPNAPARSIRSSSAQPSAARRLQTITLPTQRPSDAHRSSPSRLPACRNSRFDHERSGSTSSISPSGLKPLVILRRGRRSIAYHK